MKYIIVGCGRVGSTLAKLLVAEQHDVTVVDENPAAFKRLGNRFAGQVEVGTGIDYDVLKRAGAQTADGFIAVTDGDNRNIMAALIAQRMFKIKKIVARIYDPPRGQMYRELGIETVCPTTVGAQMIRNRLIESPYSTVPQFDFGKLLSLTATVTQNESGKRVGEIERDRLIKIPAIRRAGNVLIPTADERLQNGDEINAVVAPEALSEFGRMFTRAAPVVPLSA
jgi:trk system potassium uptake protein TrkA